MVARATAKSWFNLIAGLVVAAVPAAQAWAGDDAGRDRQVAQLWGGRSARAHAALNSAIDSQQHGDYDAAARFLQEAQARQDDLTPQEREELARMVQANGQCLQARREGADLLQRAERAMQAGRSAEAVEAVKQAAAREQYLAAPDKARLVRLSGQLRLRTTLPPTEPSAALANDARSKVAQARVQLNQGNWEVAEAMAREVEQTGVRFSTSEDSPALLLKNIEQLRNDPKALLVTARGALVGGDLDRAESLAHRAEQLGSWSLNPFADSPAKVLKEVAAARAQGTRRRADGPPMNPVSGRPDTNITRKETSGGDDTARARAVIQQGRAALRDGNIDLARQCANQARSLRASLEWTEDTPEKLLADIARAEARGRAARTDVARGDLRQPVPSSDHDKGTIVGAPARTKEEAVALVQQGRQALAQNRIDEASQCGQRARALSNARWGLFEDSPDALLTDVEKVRLVRGKEESVKLLIYGRQLLEKGDYEGAEKAAYRAQALHGNYSIWDFGDRPNKLLSDIQYARQAKPKPRAPIADVADRSSPPAAVRDTRPAPDAPPSEAEGRARQMLAGARTALQNNDVAGARRLADQVRDMHVTLTRADDSPEGIYRAIDERSAARPDAPAPRDVSSARQKALYLMAEARQALRENRLLEARAKVLEASQTKALFQADEQNPEVLYQQIAARARQQTDALLGRSLETLRYGAGTQQDRLQKAEQDLQQARQLASTFAQDTQPVDQALAMIRQIRSGGPIPETMLPPPGDAVATPRPGSSGATAAGLKKLDDARLELRHGETGNARRIVMEACDPAMGVREEALALLRSIETEEYNQKRLRAIRTFDAGWQAYMRRDYPHAGNLMAAIDVSLLDDARRARLRELMSTPEMQPSNHGQLAQTGGPGDSSGVRNPGTSLPPGAGRASATDDADALLKRTQAMREIKFQKLRSDGMQVQTQAMEKFRSGQSEEAIAMLQEHVAHLQEEELDPGKLTLLRRPVESRIAQLKLLKAQEEFANRTASRSPGSNPVIKSELTEQTKQKNVAELMKQFNTLYKEGKYLDAESMAMRAHELDPDNTVVSAAIHLARTQNNRGVHERNKQERDTFVFDTLEESERQKGAGAIENGMEIDQDRHAIAKERKYPTGYTPPRRNEREREIERVLKTPVTLNFTDQPLRAVIEDLRVFKGINIWVDESALQEDSISLDRPVSVKLENISLQSALNLLLRNVHLTYVIKDEVLQITTHSRARGAQVRAMYPVHDLVLPVQDFGTVGGNRLPWDVPYVGAPPTSGPPTPVTGSMTLGQGTPVGSATSSPGSNPGPFASATSSSNGTPQVTVKNSQTTEEVLIKLIMNTVEPRSWAEMGGTGTIDYFPNTMALVINQTPDIQDQVTELLDSLRRLQDQEVAVEIRFITVTEDFFERIGVNFNLNFVNRHNGTRFQQELTTGVFQPDPFINKFQPSNFLTGLQPSGTFTPDLNIPLNVNTFAQAVPPFGGYPGVPGFGGIDFGLAFLSDIQVFLFMEAVQGDKRTNVMQAPKLSMFNGQTASLNVNDTQFFLSSVNVQPMMGIFTYTPIVQPFPFGVQLTMQAVITADRRFVRMSLAPTLTNLATPDVELFPIVVPIFPNLDGTFTGNPVVLTQFIQQPRITTVSVQTTVAVPDGGTVLMGGLKRLSEGRNEFGPPVLSKIPFINRLFKNVGYGRSTESLLIMVTPRIIIQEEEEERQTGYRRPQRIIP
jgi:type II secretory pathway component GspD/PulD (secretin)